MVELHEKGVELYDTRRRSGVVPLRVSACPSVPGCPEWPFPFTPRGANGVEVAVLGYEVDALRRQVSRLDLEPADRAVLALLSRLLSRVRWSVFVVTPATILTGRIGVGDLPRRGRR
jgi:hypothetical protein